MGSMMRQLLLALAMMAVTTAVGCKSDSSFEEHEKTAGEEVEAAEEHGDTAIDDADEADEWGEESSGDE